jgi:carbon-monoxide dehydrogenase large subunit
MGINRLTLRKRNFIKPSQLPFAAASGVTYDSGDFAGVFNKALEISDHANFAKRKKDSRKSGKLRGIAVGSYLEVTAPPNGELGKITFEPDGSVKLTTGTLDYGQGHATPFAQVLSDKLGLPFERFRLLQGDSDQLKVGGGTGGSKSALVASQAFLEAGDKLIEQGKKVAAHVLEAAIADIEFSRGRFTIAGTDRSISILELVDKLRSGISLPPDVPASLDISHISDNPPFSFPNGCHVAEVEIDPATGALAVVNYVAVGDCGNVLDDTIVTAQMHGGVAQGLGQALTEATVYDAGGQLVSGSFMDYALPRAHDVPMMQVEHHAIACRTNPLGAKGCGESGAIGGPPCVTNGVMDALAELGITQLNTPLTPQKIWQAIKDAKVAS